MLLLTLRQLRIFFDLYNNAGSYIAISTLTENYKLTPRTIQTDIKDIRESCSKYGIEIVSLARKGYSLIINDQELADNFVKLASDRLSTSIEFSNQNSRVYYLISFLINNDDFVKSAEIAEMLFISISRVSSDLSILRKIIQKYNLELLSKPGYGIKIQGNEIDKRFCLIKEGIVAKALLNHYPQKSKISHIEKINVISEIVTNVFVRNQHQIFEIVFQNLIIHIHVAISRIKKGYHLENYYTPHIDENYASAYKMASEIMMECSEYFNISFQEGEIHYLTINICGKQELSEENFISSNTNTIIINALDKIKNIYHIDLTNDLELRISLGLHLSSMIIRVDNNMQFHNMSLLNIKQTYPLAYNLATDFISYIFSSNTIITDDEISYVAVHFISYIDKTISSLNSSNILIISSYRQSDMFLMRQKIHQNLNNINEIEIRPVASLRNEDFEKFSVVLTTEKNIAAKDNRIRFVNYFLNDFDLKKIDYALRGLKSIDDILSKFHPALFYNGEAVSKNWITHKLINLSKSLFDLGVEFETSVLDHETKTPSSYFGNGIAILHPEEPVTDTSFIAVALLTKPVKWSYESQANIVLLVSIEKNNPRALQLWNILSELITNETIISEYNKITNFDTLMDLVRNIYSNLL